jgi:uncharacterized protein YqiB (DUF1249 family)
MVLTHRSLGVIVGSLGKTKKSIGCKMALMGLVDDNQPKLKRLLSTTSLVSKESARAKIRRLGLEVVEQRKKILVLLLLS